MKKIYTTSLLLICLSFLTFAHPARAHFLWLKTISDGEQPAAFLFFGENTNDEAYHMPGPIAKTEVWRRTADSKRAKLEMKGLETEERIGLTAPLGDAAPCVLEATQTYGVYGESLLTYYAKHIHATALKDLNSIGRSSELALDIVPHVEADELTLTVYWNGKPLPDAELTVSVGDAEPQEMKTDKEGAVEIKRQGDAFVTVLANTTDKKTTGKFGDKAYEGVLHYGSLTFGSQVDAAEKTPKDGESNEKPDSAAVAPENGADAEAAMIPLPEPVSSFGAVVADGWLYVYSGHTGEEHAHSAANLSKNFRRIQVDGGAKWEELPMQTPLQGLALVSHGGKLYRVGGMNALNATDDDEEDLHSSVEFAEFDPAARAWNELAPLPAPRSSHNAVVIGDKLYVVGGWNLEGKSPGEWIADGLLYDLKKPEAGWQVMPQQPFKRRAIAVATWKGKLVVIGGMNAKEKMSQRMDVFDPQTGQWSRGPDLPDPGLAGFGSSACELHGRLYVSGFRGIVYRLNDAVDSWIEVARLETPRIFHQLLPTPRGFLLAVAGANRQGHLSDIEWIDVDKKVAASATAGVFRN